VTCTRRVVLTIVYGGHQRSGPAIVNAEGVGLVTFVAPFE